MATLRISRTRPAQPVAASQTAAPVAPPAPLRRAIRRFAGGVSTKPDSRSAARSLIMANLQLIATNNAEIDRIVRDNDLALAQIEQMMKSAGITQEEAHGLRAVYQEFFTRASRIVDPVKYKAKVNDDAKFLASVEVPINKAQNFLGEKELLEVCDLYPAKSQGFKVKVEPTTPKVTKGKGG